MLSLNASAFGQIVQVSVPTDTTVQPGDVFTLPISVGDLTGLNVTSWDMTIAYDDSVLTPIAVETDGTISDRISTAINFNVEDRISLAGAQVSPLEGDGTLVNLVFSAKNITSLRDSSAIEFLSFVFNEGVPADETSNGKVYVDFNTGTDPIDFLGSITATYTESVQSLLFGTVISATDGFDPDYDQNAPPLPPSTSFDFRFSSPGLDLYKDFRATIVDTVEWHLRLQVPTAGSVEVGWSEWNVPDTGNFHLVDNDTQFSVDMRVNNDLNIIGSGIKNYTLRYVNTEKKEFMFANGWNLFSLPYTPSDAAYTAVFSPPPVSVPFIYNGSYSEATSFEAGEGYWVEFDTVSDQELEGIPIDSLTVTLNAGWNLIGGPSCDVPVNFVEVVTGDVVITALFGYEGVYQTSEVIEQGKAYWLYSGDGATILLDCEAVELGTLGKSSNSDDPRYQNLGRLIFRINSVTTELYFGAPLADGVSEQEFILPPLPPPESFDVRFNNSTSYNSSQSPSVNVQSIQPFTMLLDRLPENHGGFYLVDQLAFGTLIEFASLFEGDSLTVDGGIIDLINIKYQSAVSNEDESVVTEFKLNGNYPNPFNPTTTITFDLPETSEVVVNVFDMLGRQVYTSDRKQVLKGASRTIDIEMGGYATGTYFYKLEAGTNIATGQIMLIK